MEAGHIYFIDDQYLKDFPDPELCRNKEIVNGVSHDRPCLCVFVKDGIGWFVPCSTQILKYKEEIRKKEEKYHRCDTISLGYIGVVENAFLIQNMFPVIDEYIKNEYIDPSNGNPVRIRNDKETEIVKLANRVLGKRRTGVKIIFGQILSIESALKSRIASKSA